jgi:hypothetical protein
VQQDTFGAWVDARETADCDCQECYQACEACQCPTVQTWAHRVEPGASMSRVWSGEYRTNERVTCGTDVVQCLGDRRAAQPGTWRVQLCWAASVLNAPANLERFPAEFPADLTCSTQTFDLPASGTVDVVTSAPAGCRGPTDCPADQLCLNGQCSSSCLPNEVPKLGSDWNVEVGSPDDAGFFSVLGRTDGARVYKGSGQITKVQYSSGTTSLTVTRVDNGIDYFASFYYTLPAKRTLALNNGDAVDVLIVEFPAGARNLAAGITLRKAGKLQLAVDNGFGGQVLDSAALDPFVVTPGGELFACDSGDCGKRLHHRMRFQAGAASADVDPGKAVQLAVGGDTYEAVAVANYVDEVPGTCGPSPMSPYVILLQPPPSP